MFKKLLVSSLVAIYALAGEYALDDSHSSVGFTVKHMMISNVKGDFKKYEANIVFDEKSMTFKKFDGKVDVTSIDTGIEKRDNHLKSDDFFNAEKFPKMSFVMKKYIKKDNEEGKMEGTLTIRDVSKDVTFDVEIGGVAKDPWGNTRLGFSLETKIDRTDFNLKWNKVMEAGGFVVGDKVKINIDIEGISLDD